MRRRTRFKRGLGILLVLVATLGATARGRRSDALSTGRDATAASLTRLTAEILERSQFSHHPLDGELAARFLDGYLDALDSTRSLFLQSDVKEFAPYRSVLASATKGEGDTRPARAIFRRFLERLEQRSEYVTGLLAAGGFDFSGHDVYSFDRKQAERPSDLGAARALWRGRVRAEYLQQKLTGAKPDRIVRSLTRTYREQLATMKGLRDEEVLEIYLNALAHVYDPHSDYLGHEQMESLSIAMNLSLFGIGATLEEADGYCTVRSLVPGGPAARTGALKPGDRIVSVAQAGGDPVDIEGMPLSRAVELIRGPKGSTVTLTVLPAAAGDGTPPRKERLVRDQVQLDDQGASARIIELAGGNGTKLRLGVIELPSFYANLGESDGGGRSVTRDVGRLLTKLKTEDVRGIVLDLRNNGGGSLDEAVSLTGLFIRRGPVVQTRGPAGDIEVDADKDPAVLYDGPLVVLTSRFSASASEILAGALQDYGRALIVGDTSTFGKGTVQNILQLGRIMDRTHLAHAYDPGALKITIRKFYRPSGASTQLRGVASDIVLPSTSDFGDVNESSLKDPLPWDSVAPVAYDQLERVRPYVAMLRQKSEQRIAGDEEFALQAKEIAVLKKHLAVKVVSLNESERRQELEQATERRNERVRAMIALRDKRPVTYAITLKSASMPGLPPPLPPPKDDASSAAGDAPGTVADGSPNSPPPDDIVLSEAEHIAADYLAALGGRVTAAAPSPAH